MKEYKGKDSSKSDKTGPSSSSYKTAMLQAGSKGKNRLKRLGQDPFKQIQDDISPKSKRKTKFKIGQHGAKKKEQTRLKTSGKTHESEHTIGFEVLNRSSGDQRGSGTDVRNFENEAYAYQEDVDLHRNHIGTGNRLFSDDSGFNAQTYRDAQRTSLETGGDNGVSNAVQLNQLAYAFDPNFHKETDNLSKADNSFTAMAGSMGDVEYKTGPDSSKTAPVDDISRIEMYLSRIAARTGKWPTEEINEYKKQLGLSKDSDDKDSDSKTSIEEEEPQNAEIKENISDVDQEEDELMEEESIEEDIEEEEEEDKGLKEDDIIEDDNADEDMNGNSV